MNKQSLDERIEKILDGFMTYGAIKQTTPEIKQLLKDVITEVTPERTPLSQAGNSAQTNYIIGKNTTIKEVHSNAKELLG